MRTEAHLVHGVTICDRSLSRRNGYFVRKVNGSDPCY